MKKYFFAEIVTALLIFLFLYTGLSKLFDFRHFGFQLQKSPLISSISPLVAIFLPVLEIALVALLIWQPTQRLGLYISLGLLSVFTIYLIGMLLFFKHLPCSCGGVISRMSWTQHIFFNLFFIVLTFSTIRIKRKEDSETYPFRSQDNY